MEKQYKDSGIEWIGRIPKDWEVLPHKHLMYKSKEICDKYQGEDIISLTLNGVIVRDLTAGGKMPTTFDGYQYVNPGDLLMCLFDIDVTPRCVGFVKKDGLTSPAYSRFKTRKGAYGQYYDYLLRYMDDEKCLLHLSKNLRSSLTEEDFGQILSIKPPYSEQKKIADYLDKKCGEIDELIEVQEQMIQKLTDYKQSVITEAVTKGLNPHAHLVPSGIDWIGDIPEGWHVAQLKRYLSFQNGQDYKEIESKEYEGFPVYGSGGVFAYASKYIYDGESVLFGRKGTVNRPLYVNCKFWTVDTMYYTILKSNSYCKYFFYIATTLPYDKYTTSTALPSMTQTILGNLKIAVPPFSEQIAITTYLDKKCNEIDSLIAIKQQKIEKLKEYKKSMIYECVTGKRDVMV